MKNTIRPFYFTFGAGQRNQGCFVEIHATNWDEARKQMSEKYGPHWAFQYEQKDWYGADGVSQQERYNYKKLS